MKLKKAVRRIVKKTRASEALTAATEISEYSPIRDGDFDDDWCEKSIIVAKAYIELRKKKK